MSTITDRLRQLVGGGPGADGPVQAVWNGVVVAESERTVKVEGNHYFPSEDVKKEYVKPSGHHTACPWKETASYVVVVVVVEGERNAAAAWYYPKPKAAAKQLKDHVAFWHGVKVKRSAAA